MKLLKTILFTTLAIALIIVILIICKVVYDVTNRLDISHKAETIHLNVGCDSNSFYLKKNVYGIAGNHVQIVLSKSEDSIPNHEIDYIFFASEIFYKIENGIIYIYAPKSSISEPTKKAPNVIIKGLKTFDEVSDYKNHYSQFGLERVSVYE